MCPFTRVSFWVPFLTPFHVGVSFVHTVLLKVCFLSEGSELVGSHLASALYGFGATRSFCNSFIPESYRNPQLAQVQPFLVNKQIARVWFVNSGPRNGAGESEVLDQAELFSVSRLYGRRHCMKSQFVGPCTALGRRLGF